MCSIVPRYLFIFWLWKLCWLLPIMCLCKHLQELMAIKINWGWYSVKDNIKEFSIYKKEPMTVEEWLQKRSKQSTNTAKFTSCAWRVPEACSRQKNLSFLIWNRLSNAPEGGFKRSTFSIQHWTLKRRTHSSLISWLHCDNLKVRVEVVYQLIRLAWSPWIPSRAIW